VSSVHFLIYETGLIGFAVGAPISGVISDRLIVKWRKKRNGAWMPEDRLRGTLVPAATCVPLSILASGLVIRYVDGRLGLILNLISMFFSGLGVRELFFKWAMTD
jgi:hypothetical protein